MGLGWIFLYYLKENVGLKEAPRNDRGPCYHDIEASIDQLYKLSFHCGTDP
jgi:hypothetical protein